MGKKTDTKTSPSPTKRAAKSLPVTEKVTLPAPAPKTRKTAAATGPAGKSPEPLVTASEPPPAPPKKTPKATRTAPAKKARPAYSRDEIALRAYFIAEKREAAGIHGSPDRDWVEAERQLANEAAKMARKKAKAR